ncbi:MAG: hypothetical protein SGJ11_02655 [Phycisphaerae bacterium]|nr:hypothetical protein [Phycisphaerae bacterium]
MSAAFSIFETLPWPLAEIRRAIGMTQYFAVDVLEAAVLQNHLHLVTSTNPEMARSWSAVEVATRFRTMCPDYALRKRLKIRPGDPVSDAEIAAAVADPTLIAKWREDLASVSFLHKLLKQKFAWACNRQDKVTGHFWEGRFKSIVDRLATIAERVDELKRRISQGEFAGEAAAARERIRSVRLVAAMPCDPGAELRAKPMLQNGAPNPWFGGHVPSIIEG